MKQGWLGRNMILLLAAFFVYLPVGLVVDYALELVESNRRYARLYRQKVAYNAIDVVADTELPETIAELHRVCASKDSAEVLQGYIDYYDPTAWQHIGSVLLMFKHRSLYYVTFGDGTQAILKYWNPLSSELTAEERPGRYLYIRPHWFGHWVRVLTFGGTAILITAVGNMIAVIVEKRAARRSERGKA